MITLGSSLAIMASGDDIRKDAFRDGEDEETFKKNWIAMASVVYLASKHHEDLSKAQLLALRSLRHLINRLNIDEESDELNLGIKDALNTKSEESSLMGDIYDKKKEKPHPKLIPKKPCSESSLSSGESSSSSVGKKKIFRKRKNLKKKNSYRNDSSDKHSRTSGLNNNFSNQINANDVLSQLLSRLDNRRTPNMEVFDLESGENLDDYLTRFESYCAENIKGQNRFWIGELESKLNGNTLKALKSLKAKTDDFYSVKQKLLDWYSDTKVLRKADARDRFLSQKYNRGESFYMFACTLERLFDAAFPNKCIETSKTLKTRFLEAIPEDYCHEIRVHIRAQKLKEESVSWKHIKKLTRLLDVELQEMKSAKKNSGSSSKEVVVNVQTNFHRGDSRQSNPAYYYNQKRYINNRKTYDETNRNAKVAGGYNAYNRHEWRQTQGRNQNYLPNYRKEEKPVFYGVNNPKPSDNPGAITRQSFCTFCQRKGHVWKDCRARLHQCVTCGSLEHDKLKCPKFSAKLGTTEGNYDPDSKVQKGRAHKAGNC